MKDKLLIGILCLFCITNLILVLAPRDFTRKIRHNILKPINMKMWKKGSLVHAVVDSYLWQKGNGH